MAAHAALALWACASQPALQFDDARALRLGTDPRREADALGIKLAELGRRVIRRIDGATFSAFDVQDTATEGSGVRVITERGILIAFDAGAAYDQPGIQLALLKDEIPLDADGDGREEVFIVGHERATDRHCIQGYKILKTGHLQVLELEPPPWSDAVCVEALEDLDGDGRPEGLVGIPLWDVARHGAPRVRLPVRLDRKGFAWQAGDLITQLYMANARKRLDRELEGARRALDAEAAYRIGVERAAYAYFMGEEEGHQLEALAAALRGLVLSPSQARTYDHARRYILAGWRGPDQAETADLP